MKDFIGQEVNVGDYFAYPTTVGRSATMNIYQLREVKESGMVKAHPIEKDPYRIWYYNNQTDHGYRPMTDEERVKYDAKCSTLRMFSSRALLLKDFKLAGT